MSDDAYDLGAEQSLLGSVLLNPTAAGPSLLALDPSVWWHPRHAEIAAVLTERLRNSRPIDAQLVLTDLRSRPGFGADTGPYLLTLHSRAWSPTNAAAYAERVAHCAARRNLSKAAIRLRQRLDQSWINGWGEPVTDFTTEMREALVSAEALDGELDEAPPQTVDDLLASSEEHDWLVPGLLERAERMIITGTEGLGKSYLITQVATCLAAGLHPFTGTRLGSQDRSVGVLVVDCENGIGQTRRRFRMLAARLDRLGARPEWRQNLRIEIRPSGLDLLGRDIGWLERRVSMTAPEVLVIGPLYRLHTANINDEQAARGLVQALDAIRVRHHCAVISEAHPGHAEDGNGLRRMRPAGSSLFMRWPEFGFGIRRAKGAEGDHPELVDVVSWRGPREERQWPRQLRHSGGLPWEPAEREYWEAVG